jgi:hypothetical protein
VILGETNPVDKPLDRRPVLWVLDQTVEEWRASIG